MAVPLADELAHELLAAALEGRAWPESALARLVALCRDPETGLAASRALFGILVEGLSDRFDPALCVRYAELFSHVVESNFARGLRQRYERVRQVRAWRECEPVRNVFVLSRVTLGADVAVTSVLLQAALRRFPHARIWLVGPAKNHALFAAHPRVLSMPLPYQRTGTLDERLAVGETLRQWLWDADGIVLDPDSRLTQLGLLPVCPEERYLLFESRAYGGVDDPRPLGELAGEWASRVFGLEPVAPFVAPSYEPVRRGSISVSLGVGENLAKRVADPFEALLLRGLAERAPVVVDEGGGGEETERVRRAVAGAPGNVTAWQGPFALFASRIAQSGLYVGYDSAGQHVAAAAGTPLVTVFAGYVSERMRQRWMPFGVGTAAREVVVVRDETPGEVWAEVARRLG